MERQFDAADYRYQQLLAQEHEREEGLRQRYQATTAPDEMQAEPRYEAISETITRLRLQREGLRQTLDDLDTEIALLSHAQAMKEANGA